MQRLFDIKHTQLEMVKDRGYSLSETEEKILVTDLAGFSHYIERSLALQKKGTTVRDLLTKVYTTPGENPQVLLVYYGSRGTGKQISIDVMRDFVTKAQGYGASEAVLIVDGPLSTNANSLLKETLTTTRYQVFFDSDLAYNATKHEDSSKHELLSSVDAEAKLKELGVVRGQMPAIKIDDPIVKYYGWPISGIVRVTRNDAISILAKKSVNYLVIVG